MKRIAVAITILVSVALAISPVALMAAQAPPYPSQLEEGRWTNDVVKAVKKALSKKDYRQVSKLLQSIGDDMEECEGLYSRLDWKGVFDINGWASVKRRGQSLTKRDYDYFRKKESVKLINEHVMPIVRKAQNIGNNAEKVEKILDDLKENYKKKKRQALVDAVDVVNVVKETSRAFGKGVLDTDDEFVEEGIANFKEREEKRKNIIAGNLDKFLGSAIGKGNDFVKEVKAEKTADAFNGKIKNAVRDITQNLANVVKYKIYDDLGKPNPESIMAPKQIQDWRDGSGQLPSTATEDDVLEALGVYEDFLSKVEAWFK